MIHPNSGEDQHDEPSADHKDLVGGVAARVCVLLGLVLPLEKPVSRNYVV
jgi:hypothetical protein